VPHEKLGFDELVQYEDECVQKFQSLQNDEYTLEHTALYEGFCEIFNGKIECFVIANGQTVTEFYEDVAASYEQSGAEKTGERLLEFVDKASNFKVWADSMRCIANLRALGRSNANVIVCAELNAPPPSNFRYSVQSHSQWVDVGKHLTHPAVSRCCCSAAAAHPQLRSSSDSTSPS
jgi:hypothetical protein